MPPPSRRDHSTALLVTIFSVQFLGALDGALLNIALPDIEADLGFTGTGLHWVVSGYLLTVAGFMMLGARLGDAWGRRRVLLGGLPLFLGASLCCALARNPAQLILSRGVQGLGAALLAPAALALVSIGFAEGRPRRRAMAIWGAAGALGGASGVTVGGLMNNWLGWRSVLLVNLPIGLVALVAILRGVERERPLVRRQRLDVPGAVLVTAGVAALVAALTDAGEQGWGRPAPLAGFAVSAVLLAGFLIVEARSPYPLMPPRLLASRGVVGGTVLGFLLQGGSLATFFLVSLQVQTVWRVPSWQAGLEFLPFSVFVVAGVRLATRFDSRALLLRLGLLAGLGYALFGALLPTHDFWLGVLLPSVVGGIGTGGGIVTYTSAVTGTVAAEDVGAATGILGSISQLGGTTGLAVMVLVATVYGASAGLLLAGALTAAGALAAFAVLRGGRSLNSRTRMPIEPPKALGAPIE